MRPPLGQHFLKTPGPARALVRALKLEEGDTVVEIGPGHGELTKHLLAAPHARVVAIERDVRLAASIVRSLGSDASLEVIHGDVREVLGEVAAKFGKKWKLAGNIPYYLTSYLIRQVGELAHPPERAALLMQKEVAERISAVPGEFTKLAAFTGAWAATEIVAHVPKTSFSPPPKVDSAILSFIRRENPVENREEYDALVRRAFTQPRKTLLNNLAEEASDKESLLQLLTAAGLSANARPQDLSVEIIERLAPKFAARAGKA